MPRGRTLTRVGLGAAVMLLTLVPIAASPYIGSLVADARTRPAPPPRRAADPPVDLVPAADPPGGDPSSPALAPTTPASTVAAAPKGTGHPPAVAAPAHPARPARPARPAPAKPAPAHPAPAHPAPARPGNPAQTKPAAKPATITAGGHVSCLSGSAVVGVWVVGQAGGSGWAKWTSTATTPSFASFNKTINNGPWEVHVGCGGTPASWKLATYSGWVSSTPHDFMCDDVPGQAQYGQCHT